MAATERLRYLEQRMGKAQHNKGSKQSNESANEEQSKEAEVPNAKAQATRAEEHRGATEFAEGKDAGAYIHIFYTYVCVCTYAQECELSTLLGSTESSGLGVSGRWFAHLYVIHIRGSEVALCGFAAQTQGTRQ